MSEIYTHGGVEYTQVDVWNVLIAAYGVFSLLYKEHPHCCVWETLAYKDKWMPSGAIVLCLKDFLQRF